MTGALPIIVSYYTAGTPYQAAAERLRASCDRLDLAHHIVSRETRGDWQLNAFAKADVCRTAWRQLGQPILWVDADAVIHARPELLRGATADFAIHKWKGTHFASGTVFFNQTLGAARLLHRWVEHCATGDDWSDQPLLERAWHEVPVDTLWLPRSYCQIFDARREDRPVIEHFQASRTQRVKVKKVPA